MTQLKIASWAGMLVVSSCANVWGAGGRADRWSERARDFVERYEAEVRPLEISVSQTWWQANISGTDADFAAKAAAQNRLDEALADRQRFAELTAIRQGNVTEPVLARQIEVLHLTYLGKQVDPALLAEITDKANAIEKAFNVYRARVGEKEYTDSAVRRVLKESDDSVLRRTVWEASKDVAPVVIDDLRQLVRLRNQAASQLGFADYHVMQLRLNEQDQQEIFKLFDQLDDLTREPFAAAKARIDAQLADRYKVGVDELRPWHYHDPFFQQAPAVYGANLDAVFADVDIVRVCRDFYAGIGLPVDDVLARSDLLEKPGKSPHAFCIDLDRSGDVRVLANITPTEYWLSTMLHELGHAVYSSKNIPASVPYVLRTDVHTLATEGVAMMFERFSKSADWLAKMGVQVADPRAYNEAGTRTRRDELLVFSRWCQVMLRFEAALYAQPDQDLNTLWWDLVEKYQLLHRPAGRSAPDFASKIHIVSAPAYYHNYMLGQLFACQLHAAIVQRVLQVDDPADAIYPGDRRVGRYLQESLFAPGRTTTWNELTCRATGAPLNAQAFAAEFRGQ